MPVQSSDLILVEREGTPYRTTAGAVAALGGGGGGSVLSGDATITLPGGHGVVEWVQTVSAVGVTQGNRLMVALAPTLDEDENEPEFTDLSSIAARALADQIEITATFAARTSGPIKLTWSAF